jgi:hypothetical protein
MFTAARGRPAADEVLLIRQHGQSDEPPSDTWEFPRVGEFDYPAALEPWTDGVLLAKVDGPFDPPGLPAEDFQWVSADFARTCAPTAFHPDVPPALRRFDGPILDQILAHIEARADSNSQGDFSMGTETRADFTSAQVKANRVANAYGDSAPAPLAGERLLDYRARLASMYQKYSGAFKNSDLHKIGDASAMSGIEDAIYNDAMSEARHPTAASLAPGQLRAITTLDASNRPVTRYHGDIAAFMDQFNPPFRYVRRLNTPGRS